MINSVKTEMGRESVFELLLSIFKVSDSDPVGLGVFCLYKLKSDPDIGIRFSNLSGLIRIRFQFPDPGSRSGSS